MNASQARYWLDRVGMENIKLLLVLDGQDISSVTTLSDISRAAKKTAKALKDIADVLEQQE